MSTLMTIDVDGSEALLATLDDAIAQLEQPRALMESLSAVLVTNIRRRFERKVDPDGQAWAPLSPATKDIYESDWFIERNPAFKGGIPGTLLERTRQLLDSLAADFDDDAAGVGMSRLTQGGKWSVPILHEFGTEKMPRRGFFTSDPDTGTLGAEDEADLLAEVDGFLGELLAAKPV